MDTQRRDLQTSHYHDSYKLLLKLMKSQKLQLSRWPVPVPDPERTTEQSMCPLTSAGLEQGLHVFESRMLELWTDPDLQTTPLGPENSGTHITAEKQELNTGLITS